MKPSLSITRIKSTSTSGIPLLYDSGVKYDDPYAFYDRWYSSDGVLAQGEIPTASASKEDIGSDSKKEEVLISRTEEF